MVGERIAVHEVALLHDQPPLARHDEAHELDQVSVTEDQLDIDCAD